MNQEKAELRRKNEGKNYAVAHLPSRKIIQWYKPGEPLPQLISYNGKRYLLTKADVEAARKNQRTNLVIVGEGSKTLEELQYQVVTMTGINSKGAFIEEVRSTKWDNLKNIGVSVGVGLAALSCAAMVVDYIVRTGGVV